MPRIFRAHFQTILALRNPVEKKTHTLPNTPTIVFCTSILIIFLTLKLFIGMCRKFWCKVYLSTLYKQTIEVGPTLQSKLIIQERLYYSSLTTCWVGFPSRPYREAREKWRCICLSDFGIVLVSAISSEWKATKSSFLSTWMKFLNSISYFVSPSNGTW